MRRRAAAGLCCLLILTAGGALYYFRSRPPSTERATVAPPPGADTPAPAASVVKETPLPDSLEQPGLVSRRFGPMRLYVSVAPEVALRRAPDAADGATLESVPILIVLENDSYREVDARRDLALTGDELFSVSVTDPARGELFRDRETSADFVWKPAERRSFTFHWRPADVAPGEYVITVKLAFGDLGETQIRTRLK